jgi:hypothetical protein
MAALRLGVTGCVLAACFSLAYFGPELANRIDREDVRAILWYEQHAPSRSAPLFVAPYFPALMTARYPVTYATSERFGSFLGEQPDWQAGPNVETVLRYIRDARFRHAYVVITGNQERYIRLYGTLRPGALARFQRALRASPSFRLVYHRGEAEIFSYVRERVSR